MKQTKLMVWNGTDFIDCEHEDWEELTRDGLKFVGIKGTRVIMTRRGYINEFIEVDKNNDVM